MTMDRLAPEHRSEIMSRIRSKDTKPELIVRRLLHTLGFRFRLHRKDLPGKPDIVLPKWKTAVFVHGCVWHGHPGWRRATIPTTREGWWRNKLERNAARDRDNESRLYELGWRVGVIWECETKRTHELAVRLESAFSR